MAGEKFLKTTERGVVSRHTAHSPLEFVLAKINFTTKRMDRRMGCWKVDRYNLPRLLSQVNFVESGEKEERGLIYRVIHERVYSLQRVLSITCVEIDPIIIVRNHPRVDSLNF